MFKYILILLCLKFHNTTMWFQKEIKLTNYSRGCHYITDTVVKNLPELKQYKIGILHLFMQHTSASLTLNENYDSDVKVDMEMILNTIIPENLKYKHSCEGPDDMPAHGKHALLGGHSVSIPITNGTLNLGTWQGIWFCEHRNNKSNRKVIATIQGTS